MKKFLLLALLALNTICATAQKTVYIPQEWRYFNSSDTLLYKESDPDNQYTWSKSRSVETENFIILWDKYYGNTAPDKLPSNNFYYFDLEYMKQKLEEFYDLEINQLGFVDPVNSNVAKYKIMVLLNHTTEWTCYGGGYDFMVPALWLNPATSKPVGHSVAHEVGHSFQYMCFSEANNHQNSSTNNTGFHISVGNGQGVWEQTAQWQANQSFPELMYDQSIGVFRNSHNYAYTHEWHRYQSYWLFYYLCQRYDDIQTIAQVWNTPMTGATDFNEALMVCKNLSVDDLYSLYFDYAMRCATWDFDACKPYRNPYIGDFNYRCAVTEDGNYRVALASCPQATGFNIIPLKVPAAGTTVTTHFTALRTAAALADADPAEYLNGDSYFSASGRTKFVSTSNSTSRGFRIGYVALLTDGTRLYFNDDIIHCTGAREATEDISFTVPENVDRMWLVVSPAPSRYFQHRWNENFDDDDMWPYEFSLEGTDLGSRAQVYVSSTIDGRPISDVQFTYDVYLPVTTASSANPYAAVSVPIDGQAASTLGTAFQLQPSDIGSRIVRYASGGPAAGQIMFYAANPRTGAVYQREPTATGVGFWFNSTGAVSSYGEGTLFAEFATNILTFAIGQYPGRCKVGDEYTIAEAMRYKNAEGKVAKATFFFNVHMTDGRAEAALTNIDYDDPTTSIDAPTTATDHRADALYYSLDGIGHTHPVRGVNIINGKKVIVQ